MKRYINIFDVGGRYGIHPSWKQSSKYTNYLLVDADPEECERLNIRYKNTSRVNIVNTLISSAGGDFSNLNILKNPAMSSILCRNELTPLYDDKSDLRHQTEIVNTIRVSNSTLDDLKRTYFSPDFLKLDIEGPELDALQSFSDYQNVLGIRSEVTFAPNYHELCGSTFVDIHKFLEAKDFILLNLDYLGRGDPWSQFISDTHRYGSLQSCDAVWIKNPHLVLNQQNTESIVLLSIFLFLNNAPDVAIWLLSEKINQTSCFINHNQEFDKPLSDYLEYLAIRHLTSLKWSPSQNISSHNDLFERLFGKKFPSQNLYNESSIYNPLESFES